MTPYLVAAYAVFWIGIFIYILTLGARQQRLSQRVETLQDLVQAQQQDREQ